MKSRSLGICIGASSIKAVIIEEHAGSIDVVRTLVRGHESNPRKMFVEVLQEMDYRSCGHLMITGRRFRELIDLPSITEPEALEHALHHLSRTTSTSLANSVLLSVGAENFIAYILDNEGNISGIETGNKCASGTGEFFLQQIRRMDVSIDEAVGLAMESEPHQVSGRCSVFCKSDCTHALNKGIPAGQVSAGLCAMMTEKILDLLEKAPGKKVIAVGGVTRNTAIMNLLRRRVETLCIPHYAETFEALGAAIAALSTLPLSHDVNFIRKTSSFGVLPPLTGSKSLVRFEDTPFAKVNSGDTLIVGLDVGSTTTKAVALRTGDCAIVASAYLRTNGNPVKASRECYQALAEQLGDVQVSIIGLGTTGSGRQIAGLHAGTTAVINEIIAHATAAAYFDKEVDTIFEIGGQDAKYTYLVNGVPCDYAMNEACSAGTGSFLEESAHESLGIECTAIEGFAVQGTAPPNFNDQCAAFISSDIKIAVHEGVSPENIVAGLVYSICMNYVNRVKAQRPIGKKIFMQGGVCYNKAVPLAMASLIGREIIVPPNPGLMGAFGVALEVRMRLEQGSLNPSPFDLRQLTEREISYGKQFVCAGGKEKCDRGCTINRIIIDGKTYPFGGACNRYYNLLHHVQHDSAEFDFVRIRQDLMFQKYAFSGGKPSPETVGISRTFLTNQFYPLFSTFFGSLGITPVLSDEIDKEGLKQRRSSFCYPAELAHGAFMNLLKKQPTYIFLPKITELFVENAPIRRKEHQCTCLILQSEPYILKSAFREFPNTSTIISPVVDFSQGLESQFRVFADIAAQCGRKPLEARAAFSAAIARQNACIDEMKQIGARFLANLENNPGQSAIVLFGRPYNAFAKEAHFGIPEKFASRGTAILPWDFLPCQDEQCDKEMCWAMGQNLLRAARFVERHPRLFGAYITNFSCGPDSFLIGYFRTIMNKKPSLTLELDSHTADAGVNTRIEAFLDIVERYRANGQSQESATPFRPAQVVLDKGHQMFVTSEGATLDFRDPRVHLVFPSMGRLTSESFAAVFQGAGIRASALPVYDHEALSLGRANTSCKECLPLILTVGGLLKFLKNRSPDEYIAYFMPTCGGNCRFTQYSVFLNALIRKLRLKNVALITVTNEDGYGGLGVKDELNILKAVIITDCMEDIKNALHVLAADRASALASFETVWQKVIARLRDRRGVKMFSLLRSISGELASIPLRLTLDKAKTVLLQGEIFVRRDYFSCQDLIERLAKRDIVVKRTHILEWLDYCDYNVSKGIYEPKFGPVQRIGFSIRQVVRRRFERVIKRILSQSQLYKYDDVDINTIMRYGTYFFDRRFTGEAILIAGSFFKEILHHAHGAISIGPFACMPSRVIEAVLSVESSMEMKQLLDKKNGVHTEYPEVQRKLPFLSIETDGNSFPQVIEARIEAFGLQVERLHRTMNHGGTKANRPENHQQSTSSWILPDREISQKGRSMLKD